MSPPEDAAAALERSLRRTRTRVLITLGASAAVTAVGAAGEPREAALGTPTPYLVAALALAVLAILASAPARRAGALSKGAVQALLVSWLACAGIGLLGVFLGAVEGGWRAGLLLCLGGLILAIRPAPRLRRPAP